ncbi:hypothetical protein [Streptomyces sp. NPDC048637]|uniref:hypothetical protein n=1 Tax=Streptomyces sp. NPDC048637 TaxID=3155636 RepID=UPI0034368819
MADETGMGEEAAQLSSEFLDGGIDIRWFRVAAGRIHGTVNSPVGAQSYPANRRRRKRDR